MTDSASDRRPAPALPAVSARAASTDYLPALTGLRGLAAGWVMVYHLWLFSGAPSLRVGTAGHSIELTPLAGFGFVGVDLFFVLSGFLLSIPFHRANHGEGPYPNLWRYGLRRCKRVLPAYYVQLIVLIGAALLMSRTKYLAVSNLAAHAALVQNLVPGTVRLNAVYWSMPIEWDFYLVLPLMMWVFGRTRPWLAWGIMLGLSFAFRYACYRAVHDPAVAHWLGYGSIMQLPARLDEFGCGVLGAWLYLHKPLSQRAAHIRVVAGVLGLVGIAAVYERVGNFLMEAELPWVLIYFTCLGLVFGAIVRGAAAPRSVPGSWFGGRALAWLGLISYSLYLWHYPMLQLALHFKLLAGGGTLAYLRNAVLMVPPILLVSWFSQRFVERPFLARREAVERAGR